MKNLPIALIALKLKQQLWQTGENAKIFAYIHIKQQALLWCNGFINFIYSAAIKGDILIIV